MNGPGLESWQHLFYFCGSLPHFYDVMFTKLVCVCLAVLSLTAFSHRIFKQNSCDVQYFALIR